MVSLKLINSFIGLGNLDMTQINTHEKYYRYIMRMYGKGYIFVDIKMSVYIHLFFVLRSLLNKNYKCYGFVEKCNFLKCGSFCLLELGY